MTKYSLRTVRYWESDTSLVPVEAKQTLAKIDDALSRAVSNIADCVNAATSQHGEAPRAITLIHYRNDADLWEFHPEMAPLSVSTHAVMLAKAQKHFAGSPITVRIEYMRPTEYRRWLDGKPDSQQNRFAWAATLRRR